MISPAKPGTSSPGVNTRSRAADVGAEGESARPAPTAALTDRDHCANTAPDSEWIRAAVEQYEKPLTQYAMRLLHGDIDRARDVVQDAFVKLWTADRASIDSHLGQWLYRVCRNRALDVHRKESRMTALSDEHLETASAPTASASALHARDHAHDDQREGRLPHELPGTAVMALLESLNDMQQEALRLKFQGGLSYKEIAAVMDITSNHVGVVIHNAIKALRERMLERQQKVASGRGATT